MLHGRKDAAWKTPLTKLTQALVGHCGLCRLCELCGFGGRCNCPTSGQLSEVDFATGRARRARVGCGQGVFALCGTGSVCGQGEHAGKRRMGKKRLGTTVCEYLANTMACGVRCDAV